MLTRTWSRLRAQVLGALVLLAGVPAVAHAQHTGLFPLRSIRRERVPCEAEDPMYRMYREQYFGYFPTCWHPFPAGWGCPTRVVPNVDAELRDRPRDPPAIGRDEGPLPGEGDMNAPEGRESAPPPPLPNLPARGPSPFELPRPGDAPGTPPNPNAPPPGAAGNLRLPAANPTAAARAAAQPDLGLAPREVAPGANSAESLLALPEVPAGTGAPAPGLNPLPPADAPTGAMNDPAMPSTTQPEQAPQRRGFFGGLLSSIFRR